MASEYREKNNTPDLYKILSLTRDVCKDPNCEKIIQNAYLKKAKNCHPDKHPGRADIAEIFDLITRVYNILKDKKKRNEYNNRLDSGYHSSQDFFKLKEAALGYVESIGEIKEATEDQKLDFKSQMKKMDDKHGFDSSLMVPISMQDISQKMTELASARKDQDKDMPVPLFRGDFNSEKFNEAFDIQKQATGMGIDIGTNTGMVLHDGRNGHPAPWNSCQGDNYCAFDAGGLYEEYGSSDSGMDNQGNHLFGRFQPDISQPVSSKLTADFVENLQGAKYVEGHNDLGDNYYADMKSRLKERSTETKAIQDMKFGDFKKSEYAGYGIFDQLGIDTGTTLALDKDDDISKRFERLMSERNALDSKLKGAVSPGDNDASYSRISGRVRGAR